MSEPGATEGERLSKYVARLLRCSRREAELTIEGGWVRVNGQVIETPMARVTNQRVTVDPDARPMALTDVTLLLHKPPGFDALAPLEAASKRVRPAQQLLQKETHWAGDTSRPRVLQRHLVKLTAAVPLETAASGLAVFTQDWRVLRKLTEDAGVIEHEFAVEVRGSVADTALQHLNTLQSHEPLPHYKASVNSTHDALSRLRFAVKGAHPGLLDYLCERAGLHIVGVKRLRIGRVALAQLPVGQWRYLRDDERF